MRQRKKQEAEIILSVILVFLAWGGSCVFAQIESSQEAKDKAIDDTLREIKMNEILALISASSKIEVEISAEREGWLSFISSRTHYYGLVSAAYNDNIFQLPEKKDDYVYIFFPGLRFRLWQPGVSKTAPKNNVELDMGAKAVFYTDHPNLNYVNPFGKVSARIGKGPRVLNFSHRFGKESSLNSDLTIGSEGITDYSATGTQLSYEVMHKRLGYEISYGRTLNIYEGTYRSTSSFQENSATLTGYFRPIPMTKTRFLAEIEASKGEYVKSLTNENNYTDYIGWLGVEGRISPKVTGIIKGGYEIRDYRGQEDFDSIAANIDLKYRFSPLTDFGLRIERLGQQSSYVSESLDETNQIDITCRHKFSSNDKLILDLKAGYTEDKYSARTDDSFHLYPKLIYLFRRWLQLEALYSYEERKSTNSGNEYRNNTYTLRMVGMF